MSIISHNYNREKQLVKRFKRRSYSYQKERVKHLTVFAGGVDVGLVISCQDGTKIYKGDSTNDYEKIDNAMLLIKHTKELGRFKFEKHSDYD